MSKEKGSSHAPDEFVAILSYGDASILEIESVIERKKLGIQVEQADQTAVLFKADASSARILMRSLGGSFKTARLLGHNISSALEEIDLPYETKFNWTISAYECSTELSIETREEVHDFLKTKGLGKSKFLEADILSYPGKGKGKDQWIISEELKISELRNRVLSSESRGMDFIVHGGIQGGPPIYAETIETLDISSFENRDFGRPFQDPKKTVSPRIARLLANVSLRLESKSLLDPFCGLGTVLQEALLCGVSIVGVDRDQTTITKANANLAWINSQYKFEFNLKKNLFAYDARRISRARMPNIDAIATEPLLVPVFSEKPSVSKAIELIDKAKNIYDRSLREFSAILSHKNCRIAITTPVLFDSSGKARTFDLGGVASDCGLKEFIGRSNATKKINYPLRMSSRKKKTVQRNLNVYYLA